MADTTQKTGPENHLPQTEQNAPAGGKLSPEE